MTTRYARIRLDIEREMPAAWDIVDILVNEGLSNYTQEVMWVVAYDSLMQIRTVTEVARGGYHRMDVSIPVVMSAVLTSGTDRFIIAHNHSTGDVTPTEPDIDLTRKVMDAANICGLYLEDHIIVGPRGESFSMTDANIIVPSETLKSLAKKNKRAKVK